MQTSLKWQLAQFAEIKWWKNYLGKANPAQYQAYKTDYWRKFLQQIEQFELLPNQRVLDAGCGPAGIFIVLQEQNPITALDPLLDQYEEKLPHFSKANYPNTQFIAQPLEAFLSGEEKFDHAFCLNCINHVDNLPASIDNLVEATKVGGKIYMSIDVHNHSWLKWLFRAVPLDILHPHQYDLAEYRQMLESRNCRIVQETGYQKRTIFDYYLIVAEKQSP